MKTNLLEPNYQQNFRGVYLPEMEVTTKKVGYLAAARAETAKTFLEGQPFLSNLFDIHMIPLDNLDLANRGFKIIVTKILPKNAKLPNNIEKIEERYQHTKAVITLGEMKTKDLSDLSKKLIDTAKKLCSDYVNFNG